VWANKGIFHTVQRPLPEPTLDGYELPAVYTPEEHARIQAFAEANAASPNRAFCRAGFGTTFFERAWALRGMEDLLIDMVGNPQFADRLFDALMEWHFPAIDGLGSIPEVDAIYFGDDFGSQRGLIMGERWFRRYLKPRLKVLYERAHSRGKYVFIHSCGDNTAIFPDLIEIGVDIFHPFQPEPQDIYALKREYGRDITFNGGIGTQQLLPRGTSQQVRAEIRTMLREIGKGGGFIAEPTKPIMSDVPTENIVACIEELVGQGA
jgi:uroporphyrinogen decarboxylase